MTRMPTLTPSLIDGLVKGSLNAPLTPGLSVQLLLSGRKTWNICAGYPRSAFLRRTLDSYPAFAIAAARKWAGELNVAIESGIDPRDAWREAERLATMAVKRAHDLAWKPSGRVEFHGPNERTSRGPYRTRSPYSPVMSNPSWPRPFMT
ncbi:DUF4102 domain-containing protein [Sphingobium fuliginis]|uniref:DUF4102 domain-containing protein n=1 Tax=Sphingobium fuliginis (strain ATCC 27551) TaxID=336203 RepID=A0A7M2GGD4_SPHSA|nr:DUF4102 domain-containing protein [Sphingobium fuliginis]